MDGATTDRQSNGGFNYYLLLEGLYKGGQIKLNKADEWKLADLLGMNGSRSGSQEFVKNGYDNKNCIFVDLQSETGSYLGDKIELKSINLNTTMEST